MSQTADVMLTPAEIAARLKVHPATVRRWIEAGRVPGALMTPGGGLRVPETSVERLLRPVARVVDGLKEKQR